MKSVQAGGSSESLSGVRIRLMKAVGACRLALSLEVEQLDKSGMVAGLRNPFTENLSPDPELWNGIFRSREILVLQVEPEDTLAAPFVIRARLDQIEAVNGDLRFSLSFVKSDAFPVALANLIGFGVAPPPEPRVLLQARRRFPEGH